GQGAALLDANGDLVGEARGAVLVDDGDVVDAAERVGVRLGHPRQRVEHHLETRRLRERLVGVGLRLDRGTAGLTAGPLGVRLGLTAGPDTVGLGAREGERTLGTALLLDERGLGP